MKHTEPTETNRQKLSLPGACCVAIQDLCMALNGRAEQGWVGSGIDRRRLEGAAGRRVAELMKLHRAYGSGLYLGTGTALAGTPTTRVTAVI